MPELRIIVVKKKTSEQEQGNTITPMSPNHLFGKYQYVDEYIETIEKNINHHLGYKKGERVTLLPSHNSAMYKVELIDIIQQLHSTAFAGLLYEIPIGIVFCLIDDDEEEKTITDNKTTNI